MNMLTSIKDALVHLLYPHICAGCGTNHLSAASHICIKCMYHLPVTGFEKYNDNPVEQLLYGRVPFLQATAQFYFTKHSSLQNMMHEFKYRYNKDVGKQLGLIMGHHLLKSNRFRDIDMLIPVPLHDSKKRKRGYNQAEVLCNGMAEALHIPVVTDVLQRISSTETQTHKTRIDRWQNMKDQFIVTRENKIENKQVLLVDDVITTGATAEACASALLCVNGVHLSIASLCYATNV